MKKLLLLFLFSSSTILSGQTVVNDFETGLPSVITRYGASFSAVANPNTAGNTSTNVGQIGRTGGNWFELIGFNLNTPYTVAAGETKYLHVYANYPAQPDVSVRMNTVDASMDGGPDIRALNDYTAFGQWQDLVFQLDGGASGITVNSILMLADLGFNNDPAGYVLNNTDAFAYVDNFRFTDSATPETLSNASFELEKTVALYPNPTKSTFTIDVNDNVNINQVLIFNVLGKKVSQNMADLKNKEIDVSNLTSGVYLVRIQDENNNTVSKRLIKE